MTETRKPTITERLVIEKLDPLDAAAKTMIDELDAYTKALYPPQSNHLDSPEDLAADDALFLGAYLEPPSRPDSTVESRLIGCGAVKRMKEGAQDYGELKRVYVSPHARGKGVARAIITTLEKHLVDNGIHVARLETGIHQHEALALYRRCGYREVHAFGNYQPDPNSIFMQKHLCAGSSGVCAGSSSV